MKTMAVFLPNWIGDVVMATPAIRALREHHPQARLLAVCQAYVAETLAGAPWFQHTISMRKRGGLLDAVHQLRKFDPDCGVLFPNSFRTALLARLGGCQTLIGFARYGRDVLLSHRLYARRDERGGFKPTPVLEDYNRLVRRLGVPEPGYRMELFTTQQDDERAESVWRQHRWPARRAVVGLNPGGAFGSSKHWPNAYFAEVARSFAERGDAVLVLCGPNERDMARDIVARAGNPAVVSLADNPLSIGLTKAVVRRLRLLITTDSGPRHFAAAFGVPVVSLYGPTHQAWTITRFEHEIAVQKQVPCGPCQLRTCPLDHRCMTALLPGEAIAAANRLARTPVRMDTMRQERRHAG